MVILFWRLAADRIPEYYRDDALWRSGPKGLWSHILREIIDSFGAELEAFEQGEVAHFHETGSTLGQQVESVFASMNFMAEADAGIRAGAILGSAESKLQTMLSALAPGTA